MKKQGGLRTLLHELLKTTLHISSHLQVPGVFPPRKEPQISMEEEAELLSELTLKL